MTFEDLPNNLRDLSLDDPKLAADVVDLCCYDQDRDAGTLTVLLCDPAGRMLQPIAIDDVPREVSPAEFGAVLGQLFVAISQHGMSVIVAFCRPGGTVTDTDRLRHDRVVEACAQADLRLIGTYVAAPGQVIRLPDPAVAA